jgi:hypothetical protein
MVVVAVLKAPWMPTVKMSHLSQVGSLFNERTNERKKERRVCGQLFFLSFSLRGRPRWVALLTSAGW